MNASETYQALRMAATLSAKKTTAPLPPLPPLPTPQQIDLQNQQQQPQPRDTATAAAQMPVDYVLNGYSLTGLFAYANGKKKGMEACIGNHKQTTKKKDDATTANAIAWARQITIMDQALNSINNDSNIKLLWAWFERDAVQRAIAEKLRNGKMREDEVEDEHCKTFLKTIGSW